MNEFDIKATDWDKNPMHWERSLSIAKEIKNHIQLKPKMKALEYGAGTGILSILLKNDFDEIILMDNSKEMLKIVEQKIEKSKVNNIKPVFFDLENEEYTVQKFDVIYTQMVIHHIIDTELIIKRFHNLLKPNGYLIIADLYKEDGTFHDANFIGHNGFDIEKLSELIKNNGFENITHKQCFVIDKKISENETKKFPVFILTANPINKS